ncbi:RagB/SusD family nutrient uptake outer membrane protein [Niabella ginsengisoli]|uniref:RagB/SusD family nutrient uptake outer membrane protein n=1 Tax=Niabella ginsengisoli TaxID=522298 RepID=A0ABS9SGJ8_9BACT|nr:RagB/SusD family nutrient uptake outer membrane protein [Niabella ginsengisoli]MCH5597441.1 RagB/SusD family nutrient uptake outer membrane protein [Niabella ginsengisoli]
MKSFIHKNAILLNIALLFLFASCKKDYLGVANQLASEVKIDSVFSVPASVRNFYANIYSGIPNSSAVIFNATSGGRLTALDNPWAGLTDELKIAQGPVKTVVTNGYNAGNATFGRWTALYQLIRQANLFIQYAHAIPKLGDADYIDESEIKQMINAARFFRAYYHYMLFEQYGPIPIVDQAIDPESKEFNFPRNSVDEVVEFIKNDLDAVLPNLADMPNPDFPDGRIVPTKGVVLAVKAKLLVYAASPLFNGGFAEALQLRNPDGKQIFPAANATKWTEALAAVQQFIDFANGRYQLYKRFNTDGSYNASESLYQLFFDTDMATQREVIWASPVSSWGAVGSADGTERRLSPRNEGGGFACIGVLQELVDAFFMNDGLSIKESPLYDETGFTGNIYNMYLKREPRFYQAVFYQNRPWQISNNPVQFHAGSPNDQSSTNNPYTGYIMYKRAARNVYNSGTNPKSVYRPSVIFRLADFYLLYAEALNEVNPGDPKVLEYIDKVRERAGIPKLADIKPEIKGNKELQREAIIAERRVELCTEGQRYFDVRRWMIAERSNDEGGGHQGGPFTGMNMQSPSQTIGGYYTRTAFENRAFYRSMYLYPIPLAEVQKSKGQLLVQNPGW